MTFALLTLLACFPEIKESEEGRFIENPSNDFDGDDYTEEQGDCDDRNPNVYPNGTEVCDGFDNDCNGVVDDNPSDIVTYYADMDGDGFGIESDTELACPADKPDGYIEEKVRNGQVVFDCDDTPADEESENGRAVNPDEDEICDEVDNDCDGEVDEEDSEQINRWYPDNDGDGFGVYDDETLVVYYCDQPDGHSPNFLDCDDSNPDIFPNADEYCDGVDNNCDSVIDEGTAVDSVLWIEDADTDGYGTNFITRRSCDQPEGFVSEESGGDCNDDDVSINPNAVESCNTADDNCNGLVDEGSGSTAPIGSQTYYADIDGDGYGDINSPLTQCDVVTGYVVNSSDCDDNNSDVNPVATESCNGFDDNCDGSIDAADAIDRTVWYADTDGDGEGDGGSIEYACDQPTGFVANLDDCVDTDASINTSATEICDSVDNNCDGLIDDADANVDLNTATEFFQDADFDGYGDPLQSTFSCLQIPGFVNNSDDCDDGNLLINPIGVEVCNDTDDDCNGVKDDLAIGSIDYFVDVDGDGHGSLVDVGTGYDLNSCPDYDPVYLYPINPTGYAPTNDDCDDGDATISPSASELCSNSIDEDCDGHNTAGATDVSTFLVDADGDTFGSGERDSNDELAYALDLCVQPYGYVPYVVGDSLDCDDGDFDVKPGVVELCNGKRDDCPSDGDNSVPTDELDDDLDGYVECEIDSSFLFNSDGTVNLWNNNQTIVGGGDCEDTDANRFPNAYEYCNGIFDNCSNPQRTILSAPVNETDDDGDNFVECDFDINTWQGHFSVIGGLDCNDSNPDLKPGGAPLSSPTECLQDLDGDGYADQTWNTCTTAQVTDDASHSFVNSMSTLDRFGSIVVNAGDVDGDGLSDVLIGDREYQFGGGGGSGKIFLFLGANILSSDDYDVSQADYTFVPEQTSSSIGNGNTKYHTIASAGDVDGDGLSDILIGDPSYQYNGLQFGKVYLVLGASLQSNSVINLSNADYSFVALGNGNGSYEGVGLTVAGAGDVDGDGLDDLLIGGPYADRGSPSDQYNDGVTHLILASSLGNPGTTLSLADSNIQFVGESEDNVSGRAVSSAGDVDGDGLDDILIGAPGWDSNNHSGRIYLILGSQLVIAPTMFNLSNASYKFTGGANDSLGYTLSGNGDVDGDGLSDIVIGSDSSNYSAGASGVVYVLLGTNITNSQQIQADVVLTGDYYDFVGRSVGFSNDLNGDGLDEIVIGARANANGNDGRVYILFGSTLTTNEVHLPSSANYIDGDQNSFFGQSIAMNIDVDGDGLSEILVGAPRTGLQGAGKVFLFSACEN